MAGAAPERILLALLGSIDRPELAELDRLDPAGWARIAAIAETHRLGPHLHSLHRDNSAIPADLSASWAQANRTAALNALS